MTFNWPGTQPKQAVGSEQEPSVDHYKYSVGRNPWRGHTYTWELPRAFSMYKNDFKKQWCPCKQPIII